MRQAGLLLIGGAALALAACATDTEATEPEGGAIVSTIGPPVLTADVRDAAGPKPARATVEQSGDSLRVRIEAIGMSARRLRRPCPHRRPLRSARLRHRRAALEPDRAEARQGQSRRACTRAICPI